MMRKWLEENRKHFQVTAKKKKRRENIRVAK